MKRKKYKPKKKPAQAKEPEAQSGSKEKEIHFFSSFEEMEEFEAEQRAATSYDERMENAEELRRHIFYKHLNSNGKWKPIAKVFKVMPPYVS